MRTAAVRDVRALAVHALSNGARFVSPFVVQWDAAGDCEDPRTVEVWGRPERGRPGPAGPWQAFDLAVFRQAFEPAVPDKGTMTVLMEVQCRRCKACLKRRAARWAIRAHLELAVAPRTWFATFTFRPEERMRLQYQRELKLLQGSVRPAQLTQDEWWRELANECATELTKYFKRIRKESGAPLRYLLVAEAHKDGFPHFHALIHEVSWAYPLRHETLSRQWSCGYSRFKLVPTEGKVAYYVCKYLAKSALCRVRASQAYGSASKPEEAA